MESSPTSRSVFMDVARAAIVDAADNLLWLQKETSAGDFKIGNVDFNKKIFTKLRSIYGSYVGRIFKNLKAVLKRKGGIRGFKLLTPQAQAALGALVSRLNVSGSTANALRAPVVSSTLLQKAIWLYYYTAPNARFIRPVEQRRTERIPGAFFMPLPGDIFSQLGIAPNADGLHPSYNVNKLISAMGTSLKDTKTDGSLSATLQGYGLTKEQFVQTQEVAVAEINNRIAEIKSREETSKPVRRSPMPGSHARSADPASLLKSENRRRQKTAAYSQLVAGQ